MLLLFRARLETFASSTSAFSPSRSYQTTNRCTSRAAPVSASAASPRRRPQFGRNTWRSLSVRYCSYRRNMCRAQAGIDQTGGGAAPGSTHGRELLPANVVPSHYHVTLEPDFSKLTYEGTVVIDLDVAEDSNSISLNTLELEIHSSKISSNGQAVAYVAEKQPSLMPQCLPLTQLL